MPKPSIQYAIEINGAAFPLRRGLTDPCSWLIGSSKTALMDINGDLLKDIVTTDTELEGYAVFLNEGGGLFAPPIHFATELSELGEHSGSENFHEQTGVFIDMNGDGYIDYVKSKKEGDTWNIYYNTTGGDKRYQRLQEELTTQKIQLALQNGHEAFFH